MERVKGKHRLDKYYRLAKEHGYRSRAAWKLVEIDDKFSFLRSSHAVLDLCAAPGGWMQASVERVPVGSLVVGIDQVPIAPIRGAISIEEDIMKSECQAKIERVMGEHGCRTFDLVLHDGSPNVGGAWAKDATSQNALVIDSVKLAMQFLAPKGNFVTKVFRSQDYSSFLYCLEQLFEKVDVFKPPASRSTSAEIYVLGFRYKAPAKIDPRLLDIKHLFLGAVEEGDLEKSDSEDESEVDDDLKAEILACGKKMFLRKKQSEQILNDAYNQYLFEDSDLPTWFLEKEKQRREMRLLPINHRLFGVPQIQNMQIE